MTRNRLTVEELAKDTLDVRELNRAGLLTRDWLCCPHCERRVARLFKGFVGYFCRACWVEHLRQCADLRAWRTGTCRRAGSGAVG